MPSAAEAEDTVLPSKLGLAPVLRRHILASGDFLAPAPARYRMADTGSDTQTLHNTTGRQTGNRLRLTCTPAHLARSGVDTRQTSRVIHELVRVLCTRVERSHVHACARRRVGEGRSFRCMTEVLEKVMRYRRDVECVVSGWVAITQRLLAVERQVQAQETPRRTDAEHCVLRQCDAGHWVRHSDTVHCTGLRVGQAIAYG